MELKDVFGEIEADGANLVHGRLLEWALTPPLWHAEAVGGRPHHQALFELLHSTGEHVGRRGVGGHLPPRLALSGRGLTRSGHAVHPGRPQSQHDVGSGRIPARLRLSLVGILGHELPPRVFYAAFGRGPDEIARLWERKLN